MKHGHILTNIITDLTGTTPSQDQILSFDGTQIKWISPVSGNTTLKFSSTLLFANATSAISMNVASTTMYLTAFIPTGDILIDVDTIIQSVLIQPSSGTLTYTVYSVDTSLQLIAHTSTVTDPSSGKISNTLSTFASGSSYTLVGGTMYYIGISTTMNSPIFLGNVASSTFNITPYASIRHDNLASVAPTTLPITNENVNRFYLGLIA